MWSFGHIPRLGIPSWYNLNKLFLGSDYYGKVARSGDVGELKSRLQLRESRVMTITSIAIRYCRHAALGSVPCSSVNCWIRDPGKQALLVRGGWLSINYGCLIGYLLSNLSPGSSQRKHATRPLRAIIPRVVRSNLLMGLPSPYF